MSNDSLEGERQQTIGNTDVYRPEWADSEEITRWLEREMFEGSVLNFPSGTSRVGDVRADVDPSVDPDIVADINAPPFEDDSFDTVYCDPPYSYHAFDKNQFVLNLWDIARDRLILQTTTQRYQLPNGTREIFLAERRGTMVFQVFQVFNRTNSRLDEFAVKT